MEEVKDSVPGNADPVGKVLLPVLLHEVNNATQLLVGLRAILEIPGGDAMFHSRVDDLGRTSEVMDDLGFAMAVVATAGGANMLLARRHERSLQIMWDLAHKALTRTGERTLRVEGEPPLSAPSAMDGWQPAWSVAALLIGASGASGELSEAWTWRWAGAELVGTLEAARGTPEEVVPAELLALIRERITPDGVLEISGQTVRWCAPVAWIR